MNKYESIVFLKFNIFKIVILYKDKDLLFNRLRKLKLIRLMKDKLLVPKSNNSPKIIDYLK